MTRNRLPPLSLATTLCLATALPGAALAVTPSKEVKIDVHEGTWMNLDVSPDGRRIVFDLLGDIFIMDASGGEARLLRAGPAMELRPRFSPDGKSIAFISDIGGSDAVWTMDADGGGARQITHETINLLSNPDWSPDGKAIVARRTTSTAMTYLGGDLVLYDLKGGSGTKIVGAPKDIDDAHISPDGAWLYYSQDVTSPTTSYRHALDANVAVRRRSLETGEVTELIRGFGSALSPQLSGDGGKIAFLRRVRTKTVLFVYDVRTGVQTPIYDGLTRDNQVNPTGSGAYPFFSWFPDNRHVAIWSKGRIWKIDTSDGSAVEIPFHAQSTQTVTEPVRFANPVAPAHFTVRVMRDALTAPDGSVVFSALGRLWRKTQGEHSPRRLTAEPGLEYEPALSPDGRSLAYIGWDDQTGSALRLVPLAGGKPRTIHAAPIIMRSPSFSPDGRRIVFAVDKTDTNMGGQAGAVGLYTIDVDGSDLQLVQREGREPRFSRDGRRIYFTADSDGPGGVSLKSVRLDGTDRRDHVLAPSGAGLRLSPDEKWVGLEENGQLFVAPYPHAATILTLTPNGGEVPVRRLTKVAGRELHWSGDGSQVHWLLGDEYFTASLAALFPDTGQPGAWTPPEHGARLDLEADADTPRGDVAFTGARLITMRGDEVIENGTVLVHDNRIVAVGRAGDVSIPHGAKVIDATGKTIMPGLMDVHSHLHLSSDLAAPTQYPAYYASLAFGVTTIFDPSALFGSFERSEMVRAGVSVGPRIYTVGQPVLGLAGDGPYAPINSLDDARNILRSRQAYGAIIAKSYMQPRRQQRQWLIEAARDLHMMVVPEGGLHYYNDISMVIDGHTTVEHGIPLPEAYDDVTQLLDQTSVGLTPTLVVAAGAEFGEQSFIQSERFWEDARVKTFVPEVLDMLGGGYKPPFVRGMQSERFADEVYDAGYRAVARVHAKLAASGVRISTGSHGQAPGIGLHWELAALSQGGMSNMDVLRAGTINPATVLGFDHDLGSLEVGKLADLIVLDGDPLKDIGQTRSVRLTMINGRLYDSLTMDEVGLRPRTRGKFYWETAKTNGVDWNPSMLGRRGLGPIHTNIVQPEAD